MATAFFITHPDVVIDPSLAVAEWPLNPRGRRRMRAAASQPWAGGIRRIFCSSERKARDGAEILAEELGLAGYDVVPDLGENDRTATGYLAPAEFEATVDAFFAQPEISVRGWERAIDAQQRIVAAVAQILAGRGADLDLAIIGHGGTGALLYCHLAGVAISRRCDQPATKGGNWFAFDAATSELLTEGWRTISAAEE